MKRTLVAAVLAVFFAVPPAAAITYGEPDAGEHPYVGMLVAYNSVDDGWTRCSGTLLSSTVLLTAGHCTYGIGADVWVTFEETDARVGWPVSVSDYPDVAAFNAARRAWLEGNADYTRGTATPHPSYSVFSEYPVTYDVGVVVLDQAAPVQSFGELAPPGTIEAMVSEAATPNDAIIETVGYGIQAIQPRPHSEAARYKSTSRIVEVRSDVARGGNLHTLNNPSAIGGRGGSCNGDSGGPLLVPDSNQVVAVVSFGPSGTCHGADYSWRVDTGVSQDFVLPFID